MHAKTYLRLSGLDEVNMPAPKEPPLLMDGLVVGLSKVEIMLGAALLPMPDWLGRKKELE